MVPWTSCKQTAVEFFEIVCNTSSFLFFLTTFRCDKARAFHDARLNVSPGRAVAGYKALWRALKFPLHAPSGSSGLREGRRDSGLVDGKAFNGSGVP